MRASEDRGESFDAESGGLQDLIDVYMDDTVVAIKTSAFGQDSSPVILSGLIGCTALVDSGTQTRSHIRTQDGSFHAAHPPDSDAFC
jgi:hypothetical protein